MDASWDIIWKRVEIVIFVILDAVVVMEYQIVLHVKMDMS